MWNVNIPKLGSSSDFQTQQSNVYLGIIFLADKRSLKINFSDMGMGTRFLASKPNIHRLKLHHLNKRFPFNCKKNYVHKYKYMACSISGWIAERIRIDGIVDGERQIEQTWRVHKKMKQMIITQFPYGLLNWVLVRSHSSSHVKQMQNYLLIFM